MMNRMIKSVKGREILDSRGNPTVEAVVVLSDGSMGRADVPSGASTGIYEALELRDKDGVRYSGKGVRIAVENINGTIQDGINGMNAADIDTIDRRLLELDGTEDKSGLGANALLAVSLACAKAAAASYKTPLYRFLGGVRAKTLPVPMMNILNGGAHSTNNVDIQEFMIMPVGATSFAECLEWCTRVYHNLKAILNEKNLSTGIGDEGGFAPNLASDEDAIVLILEAIERSGFRQYTDFVLALDAAASEWKSKEGYLLPKKGTKYTTEELISHWEGLCSRYPIYSIEDPLNEDDWQGFVQLTHKIGNHTQIVGDDLFVTNPKRLKQGIEMEAANAILIKPNQIGTLTETLEAISIAQKAGCRTIISHRSGETEDTTIADIAVAVNAGQIKTGAPCRSDRVAKYNQLLRIEYGLGESAIYPGMNCFK